MKRQNLVTVSLCFVFFVFFMLQTKYVSVISNTNLSHSTMIDQDVEDLKLNSANDSVLDRLPPPALQSPGGRLITCDRSHQYYDLCSINGPTVLDPTTSTFFLVDPSTMAFPSTLKEKIRPYPRKFENSLMKRIQELTITSDPQSPKCEIQHNVPALVFSAGGYTGNFWHEFNDGFIPLFITVSSVFPDQDFVFVISKARDWWVNKYADLLQTFSKHPIVNLDNDTVTHCFTSATLGLISHGFMKIDPTLIPNSKTFSHFRAILEIAYGRGHGQTHSSKNNSPMIRPRLVLVSRRGSLGRVIINEGKVKQVLKKIGFDVIVFKPNARTPLKEAYATINSSHAMVGVHGAALTHSLFLRPGSVFVQVVPLGLDWVAQVCFANSARAMGLHYIEYMINAEESSLVEKYDKNDLLIKDPVAYRGKNWSDIMNIYLKEQNVKFDLVRFRDYFKLVYKKAKRFMDKEG